MSPASLLDQSKKTEVELENWLKSPTSTTKSGTIPILDKRVLKIRISNKKGQMAREAKKKRQREEKERRQKGKIYARKNCRRR